VLEKAIGEGTGRIWRTECRTRSKGDE